MGAIISMEILNLEVICCLRAFIENIKAGDLVWAHDPETGETALKPVVQTFRNETTEWIHVTVNGETLTCTPEHPFYVPKKGWTSAINLRAGDILVMLNGEYVVVEQVQHELLESPETTYNFEVNMVCLWTLLKIISSW